jgi:hypothetical protein
MQPMKFFIDTHDAANGTFPAGITKEQFAGFYAKYEEACRQEGVISLRIHASFTDNRAYCLTMAPDADAVKRAHERVGLAFDTISEVVTSTPGDLFFKAAA